MIPGRPRTTRDDLPSRGALAASRGVVAPPSASRRARGLPPRRHRAVPARVLAAGRLLADDPAMADCGLHILAIGHVA
jgi:hypothetical protein